MTNQESVTTPLSAEELQKFNDAVAEYTPLADGGDVQAAFRLGECYYIAHQVNPEEYGKLAHKYLCQAAEANIPTAYYLLGECAMEGIGQQAQAADAVQYFKKFIELYDEKDKLCREKDLTTAYGVLAMLKASGKGTQRDIPLSYYYVNQALSYETDNEDAKKLCDRLEQTYPFDQNGEIDQNAHGRSKLTTFLIVIGILGCIWGFVMPSFISEAGEMFGVPFYIGMVINLIIYGGMLLWQRWSGWAMLAQWLLSPVFFWVSITGIVSGESLSIWAQFCSSQFGNPYLTTFILIMLQKRKIGFALPWCSVTGMRDDGRNMFTRVKDFCMVYGEGDAYRAHSIESKTFVYCCYIATALMAIGALFVSYLYITSDKQWGADIEWAVWKSPTLWGFLSVIGFFLQFIDWQHFSYKTINIYKDENGKEIKRERNSDILTETEGSWLYPLLMHLLVVPAMYGALIYYAIMGVVALVGALIPYVIAVLILAAIYPFYRVTQHFLARRWRIVLLVVWTFFCANMLLSLAVGSGSDFKIGFSKKGSGKFAGKPISELFPEVEKDADAGDIPDEPLTFTWDTPWCGGDVTIVRKADENQLVIMYSTSSYDPNTLYLGNYQNGQYVFCYEIPVGSLDYDETTTGISLKNNAPEDILYYGTFGKDVAKTVEYEWGTETSVDWDKVTEAQLAEIFAAAIAEGPREPIIITAKSIKAAKEGNNSDEETSEEEIEYETITTDLDQLQELIERTRGVVEECERNGESTYSTICDDVRKALESLNENVSLMSDAQRERFNALSQQAQELMEHADRISVEVVDSVAAEIDEDDIM
ncbi:MAG: hypothetical protein K2M96_01525 [Prevotella sp.]|nr:hypothetical protein [Prevotella sp.]